MERKSVVPAMTIRLVVVAAAACAGLGAPVLAQSTGPAARPEQIAQAGRPRGFSIPAQPLASALERFADQAGISFAYRTGDISTLQSPGASGTLSPREALQQILSGTGVTFTFTGASTVTLTKPSGSSGAMVLDPVQVQGAFTVPSQAMIDNAPPPYAGGQVATGGQLGLLGNRSVMDTPFNQTSYTARKAQDQQAKTIRDVLIDDPSVQAVIAEGGSLAESVNIRGFSVAPSSMSYGGLYGILPLYSVTAELAERIEVLKGPSAMLNGMQPGGAIGGTINVVPKHATDEPIMQATAGYSSSAQFGGAVDLGRRFGTDKQLGVRFNGSFRAGETSIAHNTDQRSLAVLGLDFRGERVRLSADLGYHYQYVGGMIAYARLGSTVPIPAVPNASRNFGQPWDYGERKDIFGVVRGEVDLTDSITAYATFGAHDSRTQSLRQGIGVTVSNVNGDGTTAPLNTSLYNRYVTGEVGVRAVIDTGPINHAFNVAATSYEEEVGSGTVSGSAFATNIYNPIVVGRPDLATPAANKTGITKLSSFGFADTLSVADKRIQLTVGARLQRVTATNFNSVTGLQTSSYDQSAVSPSVAVLFKPWRNISVYWNFIQGLQQGTIVGAGFTNAGTIFPPYKSTQYEAGVKADWGKFTTTVSAFQISLPSTLTDVSTNTVTLNGEQRNRGVEFNFFGEPVEGVRLLGGAMLLDAILTKTQNGVNDGWTAPAVPNFRFRIGGEWDTPFARGLTLNGRVVYTGSQYYGVVYPRRSIPDWARLDLGVRLTIDNVRSPTDKPIAIRFNVENVLDTNYWSSTSSNFLFQGAPRTFRLSTTVDF